MKVEIFYNLSDNVYEWKLWDGPDGIDYFDGIELDLGQCFEQIVKCRVMNSLLYTDHE